MTEKWRFSWRLQLIKDLWDYDDLNQFYAEFFCLLFINCFFFYLRPTPTTTTSQPRSSGRRGTSPPLTSSTTVRTPSSRSQSSEDGPPLDVLPDNEIVCHRRGVFIHPTECNRFVLCAPVSRNTEQGLKGRILNCPANQIYLVDIGRCMKGDRSQCKQL